MITLISKWKLQNGCPPQLLAALKQLAENAKSESGALIYLVNVRSLNPLDSKGQPIDPPPLPIPLDKQEEVVFIESYETVEALSQHLQSQAFIDFLQSNLQYFCQDPNNPGYPLTETEFLERKFSFIAPDDLSAQ